MGQRIWPYILAFCIAAVEIAVGILVSPTVAIWMLIVAIPLGVFSFWKILKPNMHISLKKRGSKMLILLGVLSIVCGIVVGGFLSGLGGLIWWAVTLGTKNGGGN